MTAQAAKARLDIVALQPKLATATNARDEAQQQWEALGAELAQLDDLRIRTAEGVSAAKQRLGRSAARAYRQSGGVELNAALEAVRGAEDLLDLSRDVHLISTYSEYETRQRRTTRTSAARDRAGHRTRLAPAI